VQEEQKREDREAARNRFSSPVHHNLVEKLRAGVPVRRNSTNGEAGGGVPVRRNSTNEMAGLDLEAGSGQMTTGGRKCSLGGKSRKRNVPGSLLTLQKNMVKLRSNSHPFLFIFFLTHW
jgi:hypothetical protein